MKQAAGIAAIVALVGGCAAASTAPAQGAPVAPPCSQVDGVEYCFKTAEQKRAFDEGMAEDAERKRAFLAERAEAEDREAERLRVAREESAQRQATVEAAKAAEAERRSQLARMAGEVAYARPAISAIMCDLKGGPNAEWADWWRQVLQERYHAKPLSCEQVSGVLACHRDPSACTDATRDVADVWKLAEPALKGDGLREDAPLRCCDGSDSPSCTCGGPRRGCCSHHGGVCGCSR